MAICFFDDDYDNRYNCEYAISEDCIDIEVEYNIENEVEPINGVIIMRVDTEFKNRDILVVDHDGKRNILIKNAFYYGHTNVYGTPDNKDITKFRSQLYIEHQEYSKLMNLHKVPKAKKIKLFSKSINDLIGFPGVEITHSDEMDVFNLFRHIPDDCIEVRGNNINKISVGNNWKWQRGGVSISIESCGYIEIELYKRVNYDNVSEYINELKIFMQLLYPDKFTIDKSCIMVDGEYFILACPHIEMKYKNSNVKRSVEVNLLEFLKQCYSKIPYRNSKTEFRNIPFIVLFSSRGLEDNFLMFYRFIECYYKKQIIPNIINTFIKYSLKECYANKNNISDEQIEKYAQEIICLRNHYVHSGYHIQNSSLKISFERINGKKNPNNYTVNNVDFNWIYDRTKILYKTVIDIIFNKMLGYSNYNFERHF